MALPMRVVQRPSWFSPPRTSDGPITRALLAQAPIRTRPATEEIRVLWAPNPGPQRAFLACPAEWVLYGGAVGGGKTDALLADYLAQVHVPGYAGLFIRKSYPELLQVIRRSQQLYPALGGRYKVSEKTWYFPSGATLRFGYVTSYEDALRYASDEYQWIGIDECTHVPWAAIELLSTRLRAKRALGLYYSLRLSANPNGRHMLDIRARFIDGKEPWQVHHQGKVRMVFIPARLEDTPQLAGTGYDDRLEVLGDAEKAALRGGNWYAYEGAVFKLVRGVHVITRAEFARRVAGLELGKDGVPKAWKRYRLLDWGFARPYAVVYIAEDFDGRAWGYHEMYGVARDEQGTIKPDVGVQQEPELVAQLIAGYEKEMGIKVTAAWAGDDLWHKGRGDRGDDRTLAEFFEKHGVWFDKFDAGHGTRLAGKNALHQRFFVPRGADGEPVPGKVPGFVIIGDACPNGPRTLAALTYDPTHPELVDKRCEDHWYDAAKAFALKVTWAPKEDVRTPIQRFRDEHKPTGGTTWVSR